MVKSLAHVVVHFEASGDDGRIHELNRLTRRPLAAKKRVTAAGSFWIMLRIGVTPDEQKAVCLAERWLRRHETLLLSLDVRKVLEFQTVFNKNDGSRILVLGPDFCQLVAR